MYFKNPLDSVAQASFIYMKKKIIHCFSTADPFGRVQTARPTKNKIIKSDVYSSFLYRLK